MAMQCTFKNTERALNYFFKVHHLLRDSRHDEGDDGGYMIAICEREEKIYLHIIVISYNGDVENLNFFEEQTEKKGGFPEYIVLDSIETAQKYLNERIIPNLERALEYEDGYFEPDYEFAGEIENFDDDFTEAELHFIQAMVSSYSEYKELDLERINKLSNTEYIPNFTNEFK